MATSTEEQNAGQEEKEKEKEESGEDGRQNGGTR
jgi:hypothetical protein